MGAGLDVFGILAKVPYLASYIREDVFSRVFLASDVFDVVSPDQAAVAEYKDHELHLIVDNLSARKHRNVKEWLRKHPRVVLHFTPTHSSWLNQIEIWFSILARKAILRGTFRSTKQLIDVIMNFIETYNQRGKAFNWTFDKNALLRKLTNVTKH